MINSLFAEEENLSEWGKKFALYGFGGIPSPEGSECRIDQSNMTFLETIVFEKKYYVVEGCKEEPMMKDSQSVPEKRKNGMPKQNWALGKVADCKRHA